MEEEVMLWRRFYTPCELLTRTAVSDGAGGEYSTWAVVQEFNCAIVHDDTLAARIAEQQGMTNTYTVTTDEVTLKFHDIIRRVSDGQVFRITSDAADISTPACATFQFKQAGAERYKVTNDQG